MECQERMSAKNSDLSKGEDVYKRQVWDSARQTSEQSTYVEYRGDDLKSRTRYLWKVRVEDNHGNKAEASSEFETAFLNRKDWQAKWVKSPLPIIERQAHLGDQPPACLLYTSKIVHHPCGHTKLWYLEGV